MLQRLPVVLAQIKAGNTSENLLTEIRQIIHSLYQEKEVTKKAYNNVFKKDQAYMNSRKSWNRMDTIFMNSKNSGISDPHRLLLSLTDKTNLKRSDNMMLYQTLPFTIRGTIYNIKMECEKKK